MTFNSSWDQPQLGVAASRETLPTPEFLRSTVRRGQPPTQTTRPATDPVTGARFPGPLGDAVILPRSVFPYGRSGGI